MVRVEARLEWCDEVKCGGEVEWVNHIDGERGGENGGRNWSATEEPRKELN